MVTSSDVNIEGVRQWKHDQGLNFGSISLTPNQHTDFMNHVRPLFTPTISIAVVPENFDPLAVFFDMDATVIQDESLVELAKNYGVYDRVNEITHQAMSGNLDFAESLRLRLALMKGASKDLLDDFIINYKLNAGIEDSLSYFHKNHVPTFMVSGGFTYIANALQSRLGFKDTHANELEIIDGVMTGKVIGSIVGADEKCLWMKKTIKNIGDIDKVIAVGDGANDSKMLEASGLAVGFRPKEVLYPLLDVHVGLDQDHRFLLSVLSA